MYERPRGIDCSRNRGRGRSRRVSPLPFRCGGPSDCLESLGARCDGTSAKTSQNTTPKHCPQRRTAQNRSLESSQPMMCRANHPVACSCSGIRLARCCTCARHPVPTRRPKRTAPDPDRREPRIPTLPRSANVHRSNRNTPSHPSKRHASPGGRRDCRHLSPDLPACAKYAPSTRHHHSEPWTTWVTFRSTSGVTKSLNTNDHPNRSASVTCPVADTKASNSAFVTGVAEISKPFTVTSRIGPSPSAGNRRSSVPIRNWSPGNVTSASAFLPFGACVAAQESRTVGSVTGSPPRSGVQQDWFSLSTAIAAFYLARLATYPHKI